MMRAHTKSAYSFPYADTGVTKDFASSVGDRVFILVIIVVLYKRNVIIQLKVLPNRTYNRPLGVETGFGQAVKRSFLAEHGGCQGVELGTSPGDAGHRAAFWPAVGTLATSPLAMNCTPRHSKEGPSVNASTRTMY